MRRPSGSTSPLSARSASRLRTWRAFPPSGLRGRAGGVLEEGGGAARGQTAAREAAVGVFLARRIVFFPFAVLVKEPLAESFAFPAFPRRTAEDVLAIDLEARACARSLLARFS